MLKIQAVVLRYADYGEYDRMVTLFSPEAGIINASVRSVRKPAAKLKNAAELFTYGQYILAQKADKFTVTGYDSIESFYALRQDIDKLAAASLIAQLCMDGIVQEQDYGELFILLLHTLRALCFTQMQPKDAVIYFLVKYLSISGYKPVTDVCVFCGGALGQTVCFDIREGGAACNQCASAEAIKIPKGVLAVIEQIASWPQELMTRIHISPSLRDILMRLLCVYTEHCIDKKLKAAEFFR